MSESLSGLTNDRLRRNLMLSEELVAGSWSPALFTQEPRSVDKRKTGSDAAAQSPERLE